MSDVNLQLMPIKSKVDEVAIISTRGSDTEVEGGWGSKAKETE